ncbi:conserved hypothetical protein [Ricinus communis]|uniref:Uncharacterized protein n=1 Tax=Ricinus communis TaxID=3988 RepID=B9SNP0_RICCO|nr:conserved hypothetical protein [Ricinus communis]
MENKMCDLQFKGTRFTWARGGIWEIRQPIPIQYDGHRKSSDHKPFRFLSSWLHHDSFKNLVSSVWTPEKAGSHELSNLGELEVRLRKELDEVMTHEELLWFRKARKEWVAYGD